MAGNVVAISSSNALSFTQGGADNGMNARFAVRSILSGERYAELDKRQSYYACTQHDSKMYDFDGRVYNPRSAQPLMGAEKASYFVPLKQRRPSAPYRLAKIIVESFTNLLFGENRFPQISSEDGDDKTEDFSQTLARVGKLPLKMIQARNLGGAMGTVGLSWSFYRGKPRFEVHNAKHLFVHAWEDRVQLVPRHVTEVYPFYKVQWNGKEFAKVWYWFRRDWTPDWDVVFDDVLMLPGKEPEWSVNRDKSTRHDDGVCHLEWIQNLPSDEIDGLPDYDGLYENFDMMDLLKSVVMRGATLNLDPTLKLKLDPEIVSRMGIRKGSDNALVVGKDGDAEYLELGGSSITAGNDLIAQERRGILETAQCIVPDPNEVASQGVSSVTIKALYAPMLSKADILRDQYGTPMERVLSKMTRAARAKLQTAVVVKVEDTGEERDAEFVLNLPPKVTREPKTDPVTGKPTGEDVVHREPRQPGDSDGLTLNWPPYFLPTPDDQSKVATTLQVATGGKAFLSKQTATEMGARAFGVDPTEERRRLDSQREEDKAEMAEMAPGIGGEVGSEDELPPGAKPRAPKPGFRSGGPPGAPKPPPFGKKPGAGGDADDEGDEE